MMAVRLEGSVGGYYSLPLPNEQGGGGSLTGTTSFKNDTRSSTDYTYTYPDARLRYVTIKGSLVAVCPNPDRKSDLDIGPITLKNSGSIACPQKTLIDSYRGSYVSYRQGSLNANIELIMTPVTYGLYISSGIEGSWKKGTGALSAPYDKRDASGNLINAVQVDGQNTPNDTSDDVWKLACLRDLDGKLTAESSAQWMTDGSSQGWFGGSSFTAQWIGFQNPTYNWTEPSNTHSANMGTTSQRDDLTPAPATFSAPYSGIKLGSNSDGSDLTKSSTISVKVTDPSVSLSNSFVVNWHTPYDNWKSYGPTPAMWQYPSLTIDIPGYASMGGGVNVSYLVEGNYWGDAIDQAWGALTSVGGSSLPVPYGSLAAAAGLLHPGGSETGHVPVSFNDNWGQSTATYVPIRNDALENQYTMVPTLRVGYTVKFWDGETYDMRGYTGQNKKAIASKDGRQEWIATFTYQAADGGTPNNR